MFIHNLQPNVRQRIGGLAPPPVSNYARRWLHGETRLQYARRRAVREIGYRQAVHALEGLPEAAVLNLAPTTVQGRPGLGHRTETFHASEVFARHAAMTADALEAHGIDYFFLQTDQGRRRSIVVAEPLRPRALQALGAELAGTGTYLAPVHGSRTGRPRLIGGRLPRAPHTVRVFQILVSPTGRPLSGPELGCELQFWRVADERTPFNISGEPIAPGSLINDRVTEFIPEVIPPGEQRVTLRPVDYSSRPTLPGLDRTHLLQVTAPIDAVYTWVDGDDPDWQQRKADALASLTGPELHALSYNDSRYKSRDELRYSLRSLDMYADWIRNVYVVTDGQVPPWLDTSHPRLTVVTHAHLFGERGRLPTFNSHAIETQLHHIDGLAENYLYLNDDVFFGRPAAPSDFVLASGLSKFYLSKVKVAPGPTLPTDLPVTSAAKNNRDLLINRFGRTITNKFQHVPHSLRRSVMLDLEAEFGAELASTAASQFRSRHDISVSAALAHYYGFLTGRAVQGQMDYLYADIGRPETAERLAILLRRRNVDVFCLNDHDSSATDTATQGAMVRQFLEEYFPLPSQFEKARPALDHPDHPA